MEFITFVDHPFTSLVFENVMSIAECDSFHHGRNCAKNCSQNCLNGSCDAVSGLCSSGCVAGYKGAACNESKTNIDLKK